MRVLMSFVLMSALFSAPSFAQSIQQAIEKHDAEVEAARKVVRDKWQVLLTEALTKNEQARAGEYREWSEMFLNEGALFMPKSKTSVSGSLSGRNKIEQEALEFDLGNENIRTSVTKNPAREKSA